MWDCHGGPNQQWREQGTAIVSANGKCLDVHGADFGAMSNGGKVQVWDCSGAGNQYWAFEYISVTP